MMKINQPVCFWRDIITLTQFTFKGGISVTESYKLCLPIILLCRSINNVILGAMRDAI